VNPRVATILVAIATAAPLWIACGKNATAPSGSGTSSLAVTFDENPVPFKSSGCNASVPQGWYTGARIQERGGVNFTPSSLTQKLDGSVSSLLTESFGSRFGPCSGMAFTEGIILANGAVCGTVGICTTSTFSTYQFTIAGNDANAHTLSFDSPVLRLAARPAGQTTAVLPLTPLALPPTGRHK
jgi:hypothetical protein